jgi:asparagine synthase (glutamine-hydrolysing)
MGKIAGIYWFDQRPISDFETGNIRTALAEPNAGAVSCLSGPGLLTGSTPSCHALPQDGGLSHDPGGSVCAWDGRLDDSSGVPRDIPVSGHVPSGAALHAYRNKGIDGLHELVGDWSIAIWDASLRRIVLASDYVGVRPLYYAARGDCLVWSSSLSDLVRWTGVTQLDDTYVAEFLTTGAGSHRTPYGGVYSVPPGCAVSIGADGLSVQRFWKLPIDRETRFVDDRVYEEQLENLFREAVSVRLKSGGPVCLELSGGLDSSSVVAMADLLRRQTHSTGLPELMTVSYLREGSTDERYIKVMERACGFEAVHLPVEDLPFVTPDQAGKAAPAWWEPRFREVGNLMRSLGSAVLLTGQFGDFIMANSVDDCEQVADHLQQHRYAQAIREALAWSDSMRVPIYTVLWRALRTGKSRRTPPAASGGGRYANVDSLVPAFRKRALRDDDGADPGWRNASPSRRQHFQILTRYLSARRLQIPEMLSHAAWTHPFTHRPLVEFLLTIPPFMICRPEEPRRLMRRAFAGFLPEAILKRASKDTFARPYRRALAPLAADLLRQPEQIRVVACGYVDNRSFLERLTRFTQGLDCNESQLRQLILFEFWLRSRIFP